MRVLQLATSISGGAGIAARRLNSSLNKVGIESQLVTAEKAPKNNSLNEIFLPRSSFSRIISSASTLAQSRVVQSGRELVTSISQNNLDLEIDLFGKAEIIHIHAFYNLINVETIAKIVHLGLPVFFTLHDQRLFTGGCHYSLECAGFKNACKKCPQVRSIFHPLVSSAFKKQLILLSNHKNIHLISPSEWMQGLSIESVALQGKKLSVVRNPIPGIFGEFKPSVERQRLGIKKSQFVIGFSSVNLNNPYKGLMNLIAALNKIMRSKMRTDFLVIFIGSGELYGIDSKISFRKIEVKLDEEMARLLSVVDLLLVPSTQDNSPSVIGEALMSGTQVAGSRAGGIPELLEQFNGPMFDPEDVDAIAEIIANFDVNYNREVLREKSLSIFSESIAGEKMKKLYRDALESNIY